MTTTKSKLKPATHAEVADRLGCAPASVSRMRAGKRLPGREMVQRIIEAYGLGPKRVAELMAALSEGPEATGEFLTNRVFGPTSVSS